MTETLRVETLKLAAAECSDVLEVIVYETVDSTNSRCLAQSKTGRKLPFVCFAEAQHSGRGRRGKYWLMPAFSNIAMSLCWPFQHSQLQSGLLSLSIAVAISEMLQMMGLKQVQIKWPNDIYIRGKKMAGILIETRPLVDDDLCVVAGIGLNYDMSSFYRKPERAQGVSLATVTDICRELHAQKLVNLPDRTDVAAMLLKKVVHLCQHYEQESIGALDKFRRYYDYCKNKQVDILLDNNTVLSGVAQGVTECAELQVLVKGRLRQFNSAEVSVRTLPDNSDSNKNDTDI